MPPQSLIKIIVKISSIKSGAIKKFELIKFDYLKNSAHLECFWYIATALVYQLLHICNFILIDPKILYEPKIKSWDFYVKLFPADNQDNKYLKK